ncbi:hypothetical protein [Altericroceibacterium endophyticum]|uniref:Uncharacterized protein n=1 Tax=Altericroceibacterium endophyticum TaxID=1808508 RepID=A0A6I4T5A6_9SPHN|nr:hypothetical protein [Altericroceibacterium endophyticum]MXO66037.1 hypothetical protein [Altericroceibacterium endophyticum]
MTGIWPCPLDGHEYWFGSDRGRMARLLILPPLFAEANRCRSLLTAMIRQLDDCGIDAFLPDFPGWNESLAPLQKQDLQNWRDAAQAATDHWQITHFLALRGGAELCPPALPGFTVSPLSGKKQLRSMIRAQTILEREAGRHRRSEELLQMGLQDGLTLAGFQIGPAMLRDLLEADAAAHSSAEELTIDALQLSPPWLRAEPGHDPAQAEEMARAICARLGRKLIFNTIEV